MMGHYLDDDEALVPAAEPSASPAPAAGPSAGLASGTAGDFWGAAGAADEGEAPEDDYTAGAAAGFDRGEPGKRGSGGGFLGKVKAGASKTAKGVMGSQHLQAGVGFVKDASKVISDQGHQGVKLVKAKTKEVAASDQVQKSLGYVKDKTREFKELGVVKNTTKEFKEFGAAVAETAGLMSQRWGAGGGQVERRPAAPWHGGAGAAGIRAMLGLDTEGESWRGVDVQAVEEIAIPARGVHTIAHAVAKGSRLRWAFRVKEHSVEFGVRTRAYRGAEGTIEEDVLPITKYGCAETIQGSWVADENWTVDLLFDNRNSVLRPKTVAYAVGVEPPSANFTTGNSASSRAAVVEEAASQDLLGMPAEQPSVEPDHLGLCEDLLGSAPPPVFGGAPAAASAAPLAEPPPPQAAAESLADLLGPSGLPTEAQAPLPRLDLVAPLLAQEGAALAPAPAPAPLPPAPAVAPSAAAGPAVASSQGGGAPKEAVADAVFEDLWGSLLDEGAEGPPAGGPPATAAPGAATGGDLL